MFSIIYVACDQLTISFVLHFFIYIYIYDKLDKKIEAEIGKVLGLEVQRKKLK